MRTVGPPLLLPLIWGIFAGNCTSLEKELWTRVPTPTPPPRATWTWYPLHAFALPADVTWFYLLFPCVLPSDMNMLSFVMDVPCKRQFFLRFVIFVFLLMYFAFRQMVLFWALRDLYTTIIVLETPVLHVAWRGRIQFLWQHILRDSRSQSEADGDPRTM